MPWAILYLFYQNAWENPLERKGLNMHGQLASGPVPSLLDVVRSNKTIYLEVGETLFG